MLNKLRRNYNLTGAAIVAGTLVGSTDAHANNFSSIAEKMTESIANLPGLLAAVAYLFGIILGVLGILKIKDHVENPQQTPLKDGAIRLAAGGALFALPIIFESMFETIGDGAQKDIQALNKSGTAAALVN